MRISRLQVIVVGLPGLRRLVERALDLGLVDMGGEDRDDRAGHLVLDREDVLELAVVALGPAVGAGHGIDELGARCGRDRRRGGCCPRST